MTTASASAFESASRPHYVARASHDVDEHATHLSAWQQEYDQLSRGRFEGTVRELWLDAPRLQVFHEHTAQQTSQRCQPWRGAIWFGVSDGHSDEPLHFSGRLHPAARERTVLSARADDGFMMRTPEDFGIYGVGVDEAWLGAQLERLGVPLPPAMKGGSGAVQAAPLAPHRHAALCQTIESMLSLGASGEASRAWGRAALRTLGDQLLVMLGGTLQDARLAPQWQAAQRRLASVMRARALVSDPLNHAVSVDALCACLHLTPRTLQNHFLSVVGESPAEFLRAVRLNACRRRLQAAPQTTTVQDVAAQWGFFHMGRFSQAYQAMFGERPSQTMRSARTAQ